MRLKNIGQWYDLRTQLSEILISSVPCLYHSSLSSVYGVTILVTLSYLSYTSKGKTLTLEPSGIAFDENKSYDGRVNASDGIYTNSTLLRLRVDGSCTSGVGFKQKLYRGFYEENSTNLRTDVILEVNYGELDQNSIKNLDFVIVDQQKTDFLSITSETGEVFLRQGFLMFQKCALLFVSFRINPIMSQVLDFEMVQEVNAIVALKDIKTNVIYDLTNVVIQVKDVNDNQPQINLRVLPPAMQNFETGSIEVREVMGSQFCWIFQNRLKRC